MARFVPKGKYVLLVFPFFEGIHHAKDFIEPLDGLSPEK
jgi:hypothetical protein